MLSEENVLQILEEHEVFQREPEARGQNLTEIILAVGNKRAKELDRGSRLEDGIFAAWAFCIPIFPQRERYTAFMRSVRRELFQGDAPNIASDRAENFFLPEFLRLGLEELGMIVTREDALDNEPPAWNKVIVMFDASMLMKTPLPGLGGKVYL